MNISNTISHETQYPKSDSPEVGIRQGEAVASKSEPVVKEKPAFKEAMQNVGEKPSLEDVVDNINKSNKDFKTFDRKLEISVHAKTKEVMVKVIDTVTDEVIRELPPEKVLDNIAYRRELSGMFMDKKI